jgi:hypothetical protein
MMPGERIGPATILSWLPSGLLGDPRVYHVAWTALTIASVLWACQLLVPWSAWAATLAYVTAVAMVHENAASVSHSRNMTAVLLFIHALWYHIHRRQIAASLAAGAFWSTPLYPNWAWSLSLLYIGLFHTFAGLSKLAASGLGWANGTSLQLWVHLWGRPESCLRDVVLSSRSLALVLQIVTLVIETGAIVAVWSPLIRPWLGLALLGLYGGVIDVFGYAFQYNAAWVALFFLPVERIAARVASWIRVAPAALRSRFSRHHEAVRWAVAAAGILGPRSGRFLVFLTLVLCFAFLLCLDGKLDGPECETVALSTP